MTLTEKRDIVLNRIDAAIEEYKPANVFGLFSGGDDSLTVCSIAAMHPKLTALAHMNTGIGIDERFAEPGQDCRSYVRQQADCLGCPLKEYCATDYVQGDGKPAPQRYEEMVLGYGFPGDTEMGHRNMYSRLKERPLRLLQREHPGVRMYIAGCRSQESERRMGNTKPVDVQGRTVWVNPIHDWTKLDCLEWIKSQGLQRSPVVLRLHKSGECLCGAFAKKGELDEVGLFYPKFKAYILDLQRKVVDAGFPWGWEGRPPQWYIDKKRGQEMLFDMTPMHLCHNCERGVNSPQTTG